MNLPETVDLYFVRDMHSDACEPTFLPPAEDGMSEEEYAGTIDACRDAGVECLTPEQYVQEVLDSIPEDNVVFEFCPRGFANEVSYYHAATLPDRDGIFALTREELATKLVHGGESAAFDRANNVNTICNSTCGSYRVSKWQWLKDGE